MPKQGNVHKPIDRAAESNCVSVEGIVVTISIPPLSVNRCWQGKRFKTDLYKKYEKELIWRLPKIVLPEPPYHISYTFGMSSVLSDVDNPVKPFQDLLQKRYKFNDKDVFKITAEKIKVKKGDEFITFQITQK